MRFHIRSAFTIASVLFAFSAHADNLVVNGCFSTGDFTGWTLSGDTDTTSVVPGGVAGCNFQAQLGPHDLPDQTPGTMTQTIPTTPNGTYSFSFYLLNIGTTPNLFQAFFDETTLLSLIDSPTYPDTYTEFTYTLLASGANSVIQFNFEQPPTYWYLTAISVNLVNTFFNQLTGNDQIFADYLIENTPFSTMQLFVNLPTLSSLKSAMQSAAPTRNAFGTYLSQTTYVALSQLVSSHLRQNRARLQYDNFTEPMHTAFGDVGPHQLLAQGSDDIPIFYSQGCAESDLTIWASLLGEYTHEKAQMQTPAFNATTGGVFAGIEYSSSESNVIGFGVAPAYTHFHEKNSQGSGRITQEFANLYGTWRIEPVYFDWGVSGGLYRIHNHRKISFPGFQAEATSHTRGWQAGPHFEFGYDYEKSCSDMWWWLEPFAMADWVYNREKGFHEKGANIFNVRQKGRDCSLLRGETGLRFGQVFKPRFGRVALREKGSYAYQKAFKTGKINAFLVGTPGSFTVTTLEGAQNLGVVELDAFFWPWCHGVYVNVGYQGEFGSKYISQQGRLEFGYDF